LVSKASVRDGIIVDEGLLGMRLKCSCAACSGLGMYIHHTLLHCMFQHFPVETPNVHQLLGSGQPYADMFGGTRIVYVRRIQCLIESLPKILYIYCGAHRRRCARAWYTLFMYMVYGFGKPDKHVNNCAGEEQGPTEGGVQGLGILCLCIWCMVLANPTNM